MKNKSIMNKVIILFFSFVLFYGMNATKVQAQFTANAQVSATIVGFQAVELNHVNSFSQIVSNNNAVLGKPFVILSENVKLTNSTTPKLMSFTITSENDNSFSINLPSHPVILKNSKNANTLEVVGWKSSAQPVRGEFKKNIWVVNLGASLKNGSVNDNPTGVYSGTYLVTFDYN